MAKTKNIQCCPACGQSINKREVVLFEAMVRDLDIVFRWCLEKNRFEDIPYRDFRHLIGRDVLSVFAYWKWFLHEGVGPWGVNNRYTFDRHVVGDYLAGKKRIPTRLLKTKGRKDFESIEFFDLKFVNEVSPVYARMDEGEYVVQYGRTSEENVAAHIPSKSRPLVHHTLRRKPITGEIFCTCEGYKFRGECRHILEQKQSESPALFSA